MRVVVTGAAGFVGHALMRRLSKGREDVEVIGVARQAQPGLVKVADYADAPPGDVLVHLAEINDRRLAAEAGSHYEQTAARTLEALLSKGYKRTVYASSAVLYGDQAETPRRVQDPVCATDAYTRVKLSSELSVQGSSAGVVARLSNLYGFGMSPNNVLSKVLSQLDGLGSVKILDTTPVRDFLWVEDAADAIAMMATGNASGTFNVGTGLGTSIGELAATVLEMAGQGGRRIESEGMTAKRSHLVVDIGQTEAAFGWRPTTCLSEGISLLLKKSEQ